MERIKEGYERLQARAKSLRVKTEEMVEDGFAIVEVNGGLFGWGYANETWGDMTDEGVKELRVLGMPADLAAGGAMLGMALFGGFGKYREHGINLGNASTGAFFNRLGIEMAKKQAAGKTKTSGTYSRIGAGTEMAGAVYGPRGGQVHDVHYAQR
jgi:hypothetical protein